MTKSNQKTFLSKAEKIANYSKKKGYSFGQIAKLENVSYEYVRQIYRIRRKSCKVHNQAYVKECSLCSTLAKLKKTLNKAKQVKDLKDEINRLSRRVRTKEMNAQRQLLIRELKNRYQLSYPQIALLLKRHHTSIINAYENTTTK